MTRKKIPRCDNSFDNKIKYTIKYEKNVVID